MDRWMDDNNSLMNAPSILYLRSLEVCEFLVSLIGPLLVLNLVSRGNE